VNETSKKMASAMVSPIAVSRTLPELVFEQAEHVGGRDGLQHPDGLVGEIAERKETGEGEQEEHGREQRQEEVIRQLSREAEDVVVVGFLDGPFEQLRPAQGNVERREHTAAPGATALPVLNSDRVFAQWGAW
jgi:hypothetical protein